MQSCLVCHNVMCMVNAVSKELISNGMVINQEEFSRVICPAQKKLCVLFPILVCGMLFGWNADSDVIKH